MGTLTRSFLPELPLSDPVLEWGPAVLGTYIQLLRGIITDLSPIDTTAQQYR